MAAPKTIGNRSLTKAVRARTALPTAHDRSPVLVTELAARFQQPPDSPDLPLVVINRIPQTRSAHVSVIWDKWKGFPIPHRNSVIIDAFGLAFPNERAVVSIPLGLTSGEAYSQGFLRYQIIPLARPADGVSDRQIKDAMATAGGVLLQVGGDKQLRFATRAQANEAYRRL